MSGQNKDYCQHFYALADRLQQSLQGSEGFTLWLQGETSDFVRFNHGKVRQAGQVSQAYLTIRLVQDQKHISQTVVLGGQADDHAMVVAVVAELRKALADVAEDPHLLLSETVQSTETREPNRLPSSEEMVSDIVAAAGSSDLVGILAAGPVCYGFANHHGQRNWHETTNWNFDWSIYSHGDKAVKRGSAGLTWDKAALAAAVAEARTQVELLSRPVKSLTPGNYRTYLTPSALSELVSMLNWGGFSEKALRTKRSPILKMAEGEAQLSSMLNIVEDTRGGLAPAFQAEGFIRPDEVQLVQAGKLTGSMVSPRTAKEYGVASNGAGAGEGSESMQIAGGSLPTADVLKALDTGLYVGNLWYLNFSDRAACRITGMTRFACFWVENGEIVAPLNVMRFDDTMYRMLGSELEALTQETEFQADAGSYHARSSASARLPGALIKDMRLVL
ncbi:MAG: TldE/PmbA family protein [Burkholderiales bacterium]|nr:TldE/PmbA family protein [Burkholderiales bacterium]